MIRLGTKNAIAISIQNNATSCCENVLGGA
jgi:hypothetical protein